MSVTLRPVTKNLKHDAMGMVTPRRTKLKPTCSVAVRSSPGERVVIRPSSARLRRQLSRHWLSNGKEYRCLNRASPRSNNRVALHGTTTGGLSSINKRGCNKKTQIDSARACQSTPTKICFYHCQVECAYPVILSETSLTLISPC